MLWSFSTLQAGSLSNYMMRGIFSLQPRVLPTWIYHMFEALMTSQQQMLDHFAEASERPRPPPRSLDTSGWPRHSIANSHVWHTCLHLSRLRNCREVRRPPQFPSST